MDCVCACTSLVDDKRIAPRSRSAMVVRADRKEIATCRLKSLDDDRSHRGVDGLVVGDVVRFSVVQLVQQDRTVPLRRMPLDPYLGIS